MSCLDNRNVSSPSDCDYAGHVFLAHHPDIFPALLFYRYATGVISSRKLEQGNYD